MTKFKDILIWIFLLWSPDLIRVRKKGLEAPSPSLDLLLNLRNANETTTQPSSISQRISASLNNVLRLPLQPLFNAGSQPGSQQIQSQGSFIRQRLQSSGGLLSQLANGAQGAPPPSLLPNVNQAIHTTIAQLSTLSHWPFGYVTTVRPQGQISPTATAAPVTEVHTTRRTTQAPVPTTSRRPPPPPPPPPTTTTASVLVEPPPPPPPMFSQGSSIFQPQGPYTPTARPSLPNRIHNRIHSTLNYIRLPNLSQIGNPRPRPMLTEPPWVTELLGPTLEPPTTRAPTFGERVHNAVSNVILFVPATLLNFWYQNWGTQHVDRVIQRLQISTPKPGQPVEPIFATVSNNQGPFGNLTAEQVAQLNSTGFPAIAAFINNNGTLMPTIVHPVVNMTSNTIEYQLRGENETTVLWTGSLSNDIFFGNKKPDYSTSTLSEDERDYIKQSVLNINFVK